MTRKEWNKSPNGYSVTEIVPTAGGEWKITGIRKYFIQDSYILLVN